MKKMLFILLILASSFQLSAQSVFQQLGCIDLATGLHLNRIPSFYTICTQSMAWDSCASKCNIQLDGSSIAIFTDIELSCLAPCMIPPTSIPSQLLACGDLEIGGKVVYGRPSGYLNTACSYSYNNNTYPSVSSLNQALGYCANGWTNGTAFKAVYKGPTNFISPYCSYNGYPAGTAVPSI